CARPSAAHSWHGMRLRLSHGIPSPFPLRCVASQALPPAQCWRKPASLGFHRSCLLTQCDRKSSPCVSLGSASRPGERQSRRDPTDAIEASLRKKVAEALFVQAASAVSACLLTSASASWLSALSVFFSSFSVASSSLTASP